MQYLLDSFAVCKAYLNDIHNMNVLPTSMYLTIQGWCRGRQISLLATCSDSFPEALRTEFLPQLRQVEAFFKKNASYSDGAVCDKAALDSFVKNEAICDATNARLDALCTDNHDVSPDIIEQITVMQNTISRVLGSFDEFMEEIPKLVKVSGGATASRSKVNALAYMKFSPKVDVTVGAVPYLCALYKYFGFNYPKCNVTSVDRITFVPKNFKTSRVIGCQPTHSVCLQLAFDNYCKSRMRKKLGIDLSDQSSNQLAAFVGSINGSIATVDLKSASDLLAYNTVALLLPDAWFKYVKSLRSSFWKTKDMEVPKPYYKFSCMGNGTTFPLESLIFAAACHAVGSKIYRVYGDDIAIEAELVTKLRDLLGFLGFTFNEDKTFLTGPFRESCGTDWLNGVNVTPFYMRANVLKKDVVSDLQRSDLCHIINGLVAMPCFGEAMKDLVIKVIRGCKLLFVPENHDSRSGVFITHSLAQAKGVVRERNRKDCYNGIPSYKRYVTSVKSVDVGNYQCLTHWYFLHARDSYIRRDDVVTDYNDHPSGGRTTALVPSQGIRVRKGLGVIDYNFQASDHLIDWSLLITHLV